jgi:ubiquinone/menaquinone biosynthesis C-methylase UbiE
VSSRHLHPERIADCFDAGAGDYEEVVWRNRQGAERLVAALPDLQYQDLLDVGCGTGLASLAMIERFALRSITGVDLSPGMLARFRSALEGVGGVEVRLHAADVLAMPVPADRYDVVLSTMAFHWFPEKQRALAAMARSLRPGGVLGVLTGGRGTEAEYRDLLAGLRPELPAALAESYESTVRDHVEMETDLLRAGLQPEDVWLERRQRLTPPERFLARWRAVAGHLIADLSPAEQVEIWHRIGAGLRSASGPEGFAYTFVKLFAVARRPAGPTS